MPKDDYIYSPAKPNPKPKSSFPFSSSLSSSSSTLNPSSRLIDRDATFHQSLGNISLRKRVSASLRRGVYYFDLFHSIVDYSTTGLIVSVVCCYISFVFIYALMYWYIGVNYPECNMDLHSYTDAYGFSLQTAATIGYDTSDITFGDCILPLATITCQVSTKLLADALAIGVIYCRLSRPAGRSASLLFSASAVIRRIRGKLYLMIQLCELRKTQLCQVQIRAYTIRRDADLYENAMATISSGGDYQRDACTRKTLFGCNEESTNGPDSLVNGYSTSNLIKRPDAANYLTTSSKACMSSSGVRVTNFQTCSMRLLHPNDSTGSQLLPALPQIIVHELDAWSPLMPPPVWISADSGEVFRWNSDQFAFAAGEGILNAPTEQVPVTDRDRAQTIPTSSRPHTANFRPSEQPDDAYENCVEDSIPLLPTKSKKLDSQSISSAGHGPADYGSTGTASSHAVPSCSSPYNPDSTCTRPYENSDLTVKQLDPVRLASCFFPSEMKRAVDEPDHSLDPKSPGVVAFNELLHNYVSNSNASKDVADKLLATTVETSRQAEERLRVSRFMSDRQVEVVILVEGIDPTTGGAVQAKYSYVTEDIQWNQAFQPCVTRDADDGAAIVDISLFHSLIPAAYDAPTAGPVASWI